MTFIEACLAAKTYAETAIPTALGIYGVWTIHYDKWKQKKKLQAVDLPVAPKLPPPASSLQPITASPLDQPKTRTLSPEIAARLAVLEAERNDRRGTERTVQQERERWEFEETIRRLKKEKEGLEEDLSKSSREIVHLRFENDSLKEETMYQSHKISQLRARLVDSRRPKPYDPDPSEVESDDTKPK